MPVYYHKKDSLFSKTLKIIKFVAYGIYIVRKHNVSSQARRIVRPNSDMLDRDDYFKCCKRVIEVRDRPHPQYTSSRMVFITFSKGHQVSVWLDNLFMRKYMPIRFKEAEYILKRIVVPYVPYGRHEKWYNVTGEWATDIEFVLLVLQTLIKWGYI